MKLSTVFLGIGLVGLSMASFCPDEDPPQAGPQAQLPHRPIDIEQLKKENVPEWIVKGLNKRGELKLEYGLFDNADKPFDMAQLTNFLSKHGAQVRDLRISGKQLSEGELRLLVSDLPPNLGTLELSKCGISDAGVLILAEKLPPAINSISLTYNQITAVGFRQLVSHLPKSLGVVSVDHNQIGDSAASILANHQLADLFYLSVTHNDISDVGAEDFIRNRAQFRSLMALNISDNSISPGKIGELKRAYGTYEVDGKTKEIVAVGKQKTTDPISNPSTPPSGGHAAGGSAGHPKEGIPEWIMDSDNRKTKKFEISVGDFKPGIEKRAQELKSFLELTKDKDVPLSVVIHKRDNDFVVDKLIKSASVMDIFTNYTKNLKVEYLDQRLVDMLIQHMPIHLRSLGIRGLDVTKDRKLDNIGLLFEKLPSGLEEINLAKNAAFGHLYADVLAQNLHRFQQLESLNLYMCRIDKQGTEAIIQDLPTSLVTFEFLFNTPLDEEGGKMLIGKRVSFKHIQQIGLEAGVSEQTWQDLIKSFGKDNKHEDIVYGTNEPPKLQ